MKIFKHTSRFKRISFSQPKYSFGKRFCKAMSLFSKRKSIEGIHPHSAVYDSFRKEIKKIIPHEAIQLGEKDYNRLYIESRTLRTLFKLSAFSPFLRPIKNEDLLSNFYENRGISFEDIYGYSPKGLKYTLNASLPVIDHLYRLAYWSFRSSMDKTPHLRFQQNQHPAIKYAIKQTIYQNIKDDCSLASIADVRKIVIAISLGFQWDNINQNLTFNASDTTLQNKYIVSKIFGLKDEYGNWYFCPHNKESWDHFINKNESEETVSMLEFEPIEDNQKVALVSSCAISLSLFINVLFDRLPDHLKTFDRSFFDRSVN